MKHVDAFCVTGSSPTDPRPAVDDTSPPATSPPGTSGLPLFDSTLPCGQGRHIACRLVGPPDGPLIVALGGISQNRRVCRTRRERGAGSASGWWEPIVGPGRPIDTDRYRVLGLDYPGGLGDSWQPDGDAVPTPYDQADALAHVLDGLRIEEEVTIVGASFGGVVGLAFAERHGHRVRRLVVIAAAHRSHPLSSAIRGIQRDIVRLGSAGGDAESGVALARALAMTTYRTPEEFEIRFGGARTRPDGDVPAPRDAAGAYLADRGRTFAASCDADRYVRLSASLDGPPIDPRGIEVPVTLVGVPSDRLVPEGLIRELAATLAGPVELDWLDSRYGHDAFLKEPAALGRILRRAFDGQGTRSAADSIDGPTRAVRAGVATDRSYGAVMPPIHLSVNYEFAGIGHEPRFDYSRSGNPTRATLETALAELEVGAGAVVTGSGLAAATLVLHTLAASDLVVAPTDCYGGTRRLLDGFVARGRLDVEYVPLWDPAALATALEREPALLWIETPSNPLLRITDIADACRGARRVGARTLVDNTFLSPALQRPIELGADLVLHSTTKFLNGHSDVVGGAIVARDPAVAEDLAWWGNCLGVTGPAFDAYLTLRGLRTLYVRIERHGRNTEAVVERLCAHEAVSRVWYPGLADHPGHEIAVRQQRGFGSLATFELAGGRAAVEAFAAATRRFTLAESLGGVESLVAHPATMTHAAMSPRARARAGITDAQLRLSVGIETAEDLVNDLAAALDAAGDVR